MKHLNRKAMGLEMFFSSRSSYFAGLNDFTSSEVYERLSECPLYLRFSLGRHIHDSLSELLRLPFDFGDLVTPDIMELAKESSLNITAHPDHILRFFNWLIDIAKTNEQDRVERIALLNTVASRYTGSVSSFIRACFSLNNQRATLMRDGDKITFSIAEREWGKACAVFSGCESSSDMPLPLLGYAFCTEAVSLSDGRFEFTFLFDTQFSQTDYAERLMGGDGWHEFSFTCSSIEPKLTLCDYAGRLSRLGTPRTELIDRVCSILLSKQTILGDGCLCPKELSMLPLASFICGIGGLITRKDPQRDYNEQLVLDSLDNRYAMQRFCELLSESECAELTQKLSESHTACYEEDENNALKKATMFACIYEQQIADGSARLLIKKLSDDLCAMTAGFDGITRRTEAENAVTSKVRVAVEPLLDSLKFEGEYPHYRRERNSGTDYISLIVSPKCETSKMGIYPFYVSLAAAHTASVRDKLLKCCGIGGELANALDCQPELRTASRYGELASADDGETIQIAANLCNNSTYSPLTDDTQQLSKYILLADKQFRTGRIPLIYGLNRLRFSQLPSPLPRLFLSGLPYSAVVSLLTLILYLLFYRELGLPVLSAWVALLISCCLCLGINIILTFLRRIAVAVRLWHYR